MKKLLSKVDHLIEEAMKKRWEEEKLGLINHFILNKKENLESMLTLPFRITDRRDMNDYSILNSFFLKKTHQFIIEKLNEEEMELLIKGTKKELESYDIWDSRETFFLLGKNVRPINQRVKFVTEGVDVSILQFIKKEEEKEIKDKLIELALLDMEREKDEIKITKILFWFAKNPYIRNVKLDEFARESRINRLKKSKEVKELLKNWFQLNKKSWIEKTIDSVRNWGISSVGEVFYLMNDKQKSQLKEKYEERFERELTYLTKDGYINENKLMDLKIDILTVENWYKKGNS